MPLGVTSQVCLRIPFEWESKPTQFYANVCKTEKSLEIIPSRFQEFGRIVTPRFEQFDLNLEDSNIANLKDERESLRESLQIALGVKMVNWCVNL